MSRVLLLFASLVLGFAGNLQAATNSHIQCKETVYSADDIETEECYYAEMSLSQAYTAFRQKIVDEIDTELAPLLFSSDYELNSHSAEQSGDFIWQDSSYLIINREFGVGIAQVTLHFDGTGSTINVHYLPE